MRANVSAPSRLMERRVRMVAVLMRYLMKIKSVSARMVSRKVTVAVNVSRSYH